GRFDKIILVPIPDKDGRLKILEISSKNIPIEQEMGTPNGLNPDYVDLKKIAEMTDGMSGADVAAIPNTAASIVLHNFVEKYPDPKDAEKEVDAAKVKMRDFEEAVKKVKIQKELKIGQKVTVSHFR
ncbi:MAG: AAA family ATPase, partial [Nitrosotalea sp.]